MAEEVDNYLNTTLQDDSYDALVAEQRVPVLIFALSSTQGGVMAGMFDPEFNEGLRLLSQTIFRLGYLAGRNVLIEA